MHKLKGKIPFTLEIKPFFAVVTCYNSIKKHVNVLNFEAYRSPLATKGTHFYPDFIVLRIDSTKWDLFVYP